MSRSPILCLGKPRIISYHLVPLLAHGVHDQLTAFRLLLPCGVPAAMRLPDPELAIEMQQSP
jgi:hypothetical protein